MQVNCYEFPTHLPIPSDYPQQPEALPDVPSPQLPMYRYTPLVTTLPTPTPPVNTYPGLFTGPSEFNPIPGIQFLSLDDAYRMQALFAANQFLTHRLAEQGLTSVPEANPFIITGQSRSGTIAGLYSETALLSTTLGVIGYELFGQWRAQVTTAFANFKVDMAAYAPWFDTSDGARGITALVVQGHAKLREVHDLIRTHNEARLNFVGVQQLVTTDPPERERGEQW